MNAVFVELPPFERHRSRHLDDEGLRALQEALMIAPEAGPVIQGTGGLRKLQKEDLTQDQRAALRALLDAEVSIRGVP